MILTDRIRSDKIGLQALKLNFTVATFTFHLKQERISMHTDTTMKHSFTHTRKMNVRLRCGSATKLNGLARYAPQVATPHYVVLEEGLPEF